MFTIKCLTAPKSLANLLCTLDLRKAQRRLLDMLRSTPVVLRDGDVWSPPMSMRLAHHVHHFVGYHNRCLVNRKAAHHAEFRTGHHGVSKPPVSRSRRSAKVARVPLSL